MRLLLDDKEVDLYSPEGLQAAARLWMKVSCHYKLMYEPTWLGIPIIQYPEDIVVMQELIWRLRPDVIVETGVAHGGSAVLYASILEIMGKGRVIGVDVEIRQFNRVAIQSHPLAHRIHLVEGSSVDPAVVARVAGMARDKGRVLVVLDSNHSAEHVFQEMSLYAGLVSAGSYLVVMDGLQGDVWDIPRGKKEWREDNPLTAIRRFLAANPEWEADPHYNRLHITSNPMGFLRRRQTD